MNRKGCRRTKREAAELNARGEGGGYSRRERARCRHAPSATIHSARKRKRNREVGEREDKERKKG